VWVVIVAVRSAFIERRRRLKRYGCTAVYPEPPETFAKSIDQRTPFFPAGIE